MTTSLYPSMCGVFATMHITRFLSWLVGIKLSGSSGFFDIFLPRLVGGAGDGKHKNRLP